MMRRGWLVLLGLVAILGMAAAACGGGGSKCGNCDDGIECTVDSCNAADKVCQHEAVHELCAAGQVCDLEQGCIEPPPCTSDAECDDGNPCTDDACDQAAGCTYTNNTAACDDGDACTEDDTCAAGVCGGTAVSCDDGNVCTDDTCDPAAGCQHANNTAACDDGSVCTSDDVCADGVCGGSAVTCDDANPCTDDACDAVDGCVFTNNTADCDDGDACTEGDVCADGTCAGTAADCDDGNGCTTDSCDAVEGCQHTNNSLDCDDGSACTSDDVCADGVCAGSAVNCDDGNVCTDDSCDPVTGCTNVNNTAACDDGNDCTQDDTCADGSCVGGANNCECEQDADCAGSEDGNLCNGTLHCVNNACVVDPATIVSCDPGGDTACLENTCNPVDGSCAMQNVNEGGICDDGDACTLTDVCTSGTCAGSARTCDDGNACTDDSCDPDSGCVFTNNTAACDDGNACTDNDVCSAGSCGGAMVDCDDGNICTTDTCVPADGCHYEDNTVACDDGDACTENDVCGAGSCGGSAVTCDDGNVCTDDSCDPDSGCVFADNTAACDDGDACTENDVCAGGTCGGSAVDCDDGNVCTDDTCDANDGCQYANNTAACDDADACTENDICGGGTCGGSAVTCDDGNVCTDDSCDSASGCVFTDNTAACDDGVACTETDTCSGGNCAGTPVDANCDDGNVCTDDSCNPDSGCVFANNTVACDDGDDVCTVNDVCSAGVCSGDEACCGDVIDNDGDGLTDCTDGDCSSDPACLACTGTLAEVRAAADGPVDPPICIDGARVTYLRPVGGSGNGYYIQRNQVGPAVFVYLGAEQPTVEVGNTLRLLVSNVTEYNGLKEVDGSLIVTNDGVAATIDDLVQDFSAGPAVDEDAESELVFINNGLVVAGGGSSWVVAYGDSYQVPVYSTEWASVSPCPGMSVSLQAPAGQYFASYQLTPYFADDFLATDASGCNLPIDYCRLQWPPSIAGNAGETADVYGRLYVAGLTDQTTGNDPWPSVIGQLGYGPDASAPDGSWVWLDAAPNPVWNDAGDPNNDEYFATLTLPDPAGSPYDYAFRFSGDGGQNWTYCDLDGTGNDYSSAQAGDLQVTGGSAVNLYFSEYVEGSSNNKAVEVYNAGSDAVDLTTCEISLYANGTADPTSTVTLTGTLDPGEVYVACNSSSVPDIMTVCDLTTGVMNFNGDDALTLSCGGVTMDVFGQIGVDPGSYWEGSATGSNSVNHTLIRYCSVTEGDPDGSDAFDLDPEWYQLDVDTFTDLGLRTFCP